MNTGLLLVSIIAMASGFLLRHALGKGTLPRMKLTLVQSVYLWVAIFAGLLAFTKALQWMVERGAL